MTRAGRPVLQVAAAALLALLVLIAPAARAHEYKLDALVTVFARVQGNEAQLLVRAPLYLFRADKFPIKGNEIDIDNARPAMERALASLQRSMVLLEDGRPLAATFAVGRLSLPSDRSFDQAESAAAHIATPADASAGIVIDQGYVDAQLGYSIAAPQGVHALRTLIAPELGESLKLTIRYTGPAGESRTLIVSGGAGTTELDPTWIGAAGSFVAMGIAHIASGADHLLFLLCLIIPLRGVRTLLTVVTGFTVAHSFTLLGSAFGLAPRGAWFPPFVEMAIALSIVYTALENIVGVEVRRRVLLAMLFGLVHGFGFSQGLSHELQFAGSHLLVALFAFNLGIEIGQIAVLLLLLPLLALATRHVLPGRVGSIILSALVAHVGWHWMADRWDALQAVRWPAPGLEDLPALLLWAAALSLMAGIALAAGSRRRALTSSAG